MNYNRIFLIALLLVRVDDDGRSIPILSLSRTEEEVEYIIQHQNSGTNQENNPPLRQSLLNNFEKNKLFIITFKNLI